jgi:hypothetical protein
MVKTLEGEIGALSVIAHPVYSECTATVKQAIFAAVNPLAQPRT